jgi:hypothetical protein
MSILNLIASTSTIKDGLDKQKTSYTDNILEEIFIPKGNLIYQLIYQEIKLKKIKYFLI